MNPVDDSELVDTDNYSCIWFENGRRDLRQVDTANPNFLQEAIYPLLSETHAGEDVAIYADRAGAQLIHGVMEQNWIVNVMTEALGIAPVNK